MKPRLCQTLIESTDSRGVVLSNNALFGELSKKISFFASVYDDIRVRVEGRD